MIRKIGLVGLVLTVMIFLFGTYSAKAKITLIEEDFEKKVQKNVVEVYEKDLETPAAARIIIDELLRLDRDLPLGKDVVVVIWSPGGNLSAALAVCDVILALTHDVVTIGMGQVASGATLILSSGTRGKRYLSSHALIMIHEPWFILPGGILKISEVGGIGKIGDKIAETMYRLIAENTGKDVKQVRKDCEKEELWLTAEESLKYGKYGLADKILTSKEIKLLWEPKEKEKKNSKKEGEKLFKEFFEKIEKNIKERNK